MSEPRPWACGHCQQRLLWRRTPEGATSVECPTHGPLAHLYPAMPTEGEQQ